MSEEGNVEECQNTERIQELYEEKGIKLDPGQIDIDRPGGLLTKTDRKYLIGQKKHEHQQSDAKRRQEIRKRVENGFLDISLMLYFLEHKEKKKIFDEYDEQTLTKVLSDLMAFIFTGTSQNIENFEKIIERGVSTGSSFDQSGRWVGNVIDVNAEIDILDIPDTDQLYEQLKAEKYGRGRRLSPEEIGLLVRDGKISKDELDKLQHPPNHPGAPISSPQADSEFRENLIEELKEEFNDKSAKSIEEFLEENEFRGVHSDLVEKALQEELSQRD